MWDIFLKNLPLAIILIIATIICGADLIKAIGVWKAKGKEKVDQGIKENQEKVDLANTLKELKEEIGKVNQKLGDQEEKFERMETRLQDLTVSDMHDIKSWIVDQYHRFYIEQGWIDAFNAETIDRRYEDYKKEGGNSYIDTLVERLHTLPMDPPLDSRN